MKFLASKPELDAGGFVLARAYALLSTERSNGFGLGPIRISKVWEWLDRKGIRDPYIRTHVEDVITAIDAITLRRANKKPSSGKGHDAASEPPTPKPKSSASKRSRRMKA